VTGEQSTAVRVLVAPDAFKGTFSAVEVAEAIGCGIEHLARRGPLPGRGRGEGTLEVLLAALGGERVAALAHDPLGRRARHVLLGLQSVVEASTREDLTAAAETLAQRLAREG
jgi:glycerate kinase